MISPCSRFAERLVSLAEGNSDPAVEAHVAACAGCTEALAHYQEIFAVARRQAYAVPVSVVEAAKAIMPTTRRVVVARLIRSNMLAGARAVPADLQVTLDVDGEQMRVMYTRRESGYDVLGMLPGPDWHAERDAGEIAHSGESRFAFLAARLEATGFRVADRHRSVIVPPIQELIYGASGAR